MRERLWPDGTFVDFEHSVNAAIKRLRAALGDTAENPRFVETLHRRGYRFVAPIDQAAAPAEPGAGCSWRRPRQPDRRPRLVVLPFTNLSGDHVPDYFSDGLTEEMIAQVGRRCASRIGVLARTSSMLYKNVVRGASDIGEALHADYLVEGSVRREGDRVRITAQLIETKGETHLWAESYDRHLADCLAVQTEVASQIAHALTQELLPQPSAIGIGTTNPAAYQAFLRGRFHWNLPGPAGLEPAVESYDQAILLDPRLGKAYTARARARVSLCDYYLIEPRIGLEAARQDALRALEFDGGDAEAHLALAEVLRTLDWDWEGAEREYRRALASNPNCEAAHKYYAVFLAARGRAEAPVMADRACEIDPLCLTMNTAAATVHYFRGDYDRALDRFIRTLDMDPSFVPARRGLAAALVQFGRIEEAIGNLTALPDDRGDPVTQAWLGHALAVQGDKAGARKIAGALVRRASAGSCPPTISHCSTPGSRISTRHSRSWIARARRATPRSIRWTSSRASGSCAAIRATRACWIEAEAQITQAGQVGRVGRRAVGRVGRVGQAGMPRNRPSGGSQHYSNTVNFFPLAAGPHPPRRTDADPSPRISMSSAQDGRRRFLPFFFPTCLTRPTSPTSPTRLLRAPAAQSPGRFSMRARPGWRTRSVQPVRERPSLRSASVDRAR